MTDFLPEYGQMPLNGQYAALYRLFTGQDWRHVCDPATKKPRLFPSAISAINGAKDHVRVKLNPELKVDGTPAQEDEDILGVKDWLLGKQAETAEAKIIRNRKSKSKVVVERRERRGAALIKGRSS